jgi:hypothetical protein
MTLKGGAVQRRGEALPPSELGRMSFFDPDQTFAVHQTGRMSGESDIGGRTPYMSVRHNHSTGPYR